jgi:hypothetical protein
VRAAQGQDSEAEELFNAALDVRLKRLGPAHPKSLESLGSLADFYIAGKNYQAAEKPLRAIVEVREKTDGAEAITLITPLESLAVVLKATDRSKEAEEIDARVKKIGDAEKKAAEEAKKATEEAEKVVAEKDRPANEAKPAAAK